MRWYNHTPTTAFVVYAATGTLSSAILAVLGSYLPHILQFGRCRHRIFTHLPYTPVVLFTICFRLLYSESSYGYYLGTFALLGYLIHLTLELLCGEGVPLGGKASIKMGLVTHDDAKEGFVILSVVVIALLVAGIRGFLAFEYLSDANAHAASFLHDLIRWALAAQGFSR